MKGNLQNEIKYLQSIYLIYKGLLPLNKQKNQITQLENGQRDFPCGAMDKNLPANARDKGLIPGLGRSPGKGNGNPCQYSCLENSMERGAWLATVHGVTKSWHDWATNTFFSLRAYHSSVQNPPKPSQLTKNKSSSPYSDLQVLLHHHFTPTHTHTYSLTHKL